MFGENGVYQCFINYNQGDRPWGNGDNCLDAIEHGVVMYLRHNSKRGFQQPAQQQPQQLSVKKFDPQEMGYFFSFEARIFWYYFAKKYNKERLIAHYEAEAMKANPDFVNSMRFLVEVATKTIDDINAKLYEKIPAIHNVWIQSIVYYESLLLERYENAQVIRDLISKTGEEDKQGFKGIQKTIAEIDKEIQTLD